MGNRLLTHVRKGMITHSKEWCKHLRKYGRRLFWKSNRQAEDHEIRSEAKRSRKEELLR